MPRYGSISDDDATLNTHQGCTRIETDPLGACRACYLFREPWVSWKVHRTGTDMNTVTIRPLENVLKELRSWSKSPPVRIFLEDMGDLFHESIPFPMIETWIRELVERHPQYVWRICSRRVPRMAAFWRQRGVVPSNTWIGTSISSMRFRDRRLALLREIPARVRWLSVEPLSEDISQGLDLTGINWVIVGGMSGPGARDLDPVWVRNLYQICVKQGVRFWFKQRSSETPKQHAGGQVCLCGCNSVHHELP